MHNLKKLILSFFLLFTVTFSYSQNIEIYGLWWESTGPGFAGNEHLVQIDPLTGQYTSIGIMPNVYAVNLGSSTFDQRNGHYIFRGVETGNNQSNLYSVNVDDASLNSNTVLTENVIEWEYDLKNSLLYGLKFIETGQLYDTLYIEDYYNGNVIDTILEPIGFPNGNEYLVSLDFNTGNNIVVGFIDGVTSILVNSSTFNSNDGTYIFVGNDTANIKRLYSIDVATGNTIESPQINTYAYIELEYNNVDDKLYAIQNNAGSLKFGELDLNTTNFTLINNLNFLSGGGVAVGSTVLDQNTGYYIITGVVSGSKSIYIIDTSTGTLISSTLLNENINEWEVNNYTNFARTYYQVEDNMEYCNTNLVLDTNAIYSGNYQAEEELESRGKIKSNANVRLTAKNVVSLKSNFSIPQNATLSIRNIDCIENAGCCPEDPLAEPFMQNYTDGIVGFKVFQAKDEHGNCLYRIESDYSTACQTTIADLGVSIIDCVGASVCGYGGFTPYPVNTCIDNFGTSFNSLDWELIYSCDMQ